jgi:hypothetical protein
LLRNGRHSKRLTDFFFQNVPCPSDVAQDGTVDIDDLFTVIAAWGDCDNCPADINDDDTVDIDDLFAIIEAWGACP